MASIDSIIANAQSLALQSAANATGMYNDAIQAASSNHTVNFQTIAAVNAVDDLTYANAPEFKTTLDAVTPASGLDTNFAAQTLAQRATMKSFVAGGMTDWITSFAPDYLASQAELTAKITSGMTGGSAISNAVEQAIFDRARDRIDAENTAAQTQLAATMVKRGFPLPSGVLAAGLRQVQKDSAERIARGATEAAIQRAMLENQFATACVSASQALNQGVQGAITTYAGIVATVNESTMNYANAIVQSIDAQVKSQLAVAVSKFEAGDATFKNDLAELQTNVGHLAKKLELQIAEAGLLLDRAKAQTMADVQLEQTEAQIHMSSINAMVNAANSGAGPQSAIASAAISTGNTLVQQTGE